ncbi:unnamed protein product [Chondrus crispus]|uniref:Probable ATP-dependent transporter ycf16 n=1 Tax=Chondrus crispus TaxID=2769 RepID=R7QLB5_CHOCR|nr:unnamed protein product [Chondrus crispus]CDF38271.1 unnamed protein product [Chondrus crispus]|eukprot:XP_005718156.1 unnamed protein product [Chondrus crispus]
MGGWHPLDACHCLESTVTADPTLSGPLSPFICSCTLYLPFSCISVVSRTVNNTSAPPSCTVPPLHFVVPPLRPTPASQSRTAIADNRVMADDVTAQPASPALKPDKGNPDVDGERRPCPEASANWISHIFLGWVFSLVYNGWKKPLLDDYLWELRDFERGSATTTALTKNWHNVLDEEKPKNRLFSAIFRTNRRKLFISAIFKAIELSLATLQPVLINKLLVFNESDEPIGVGLAWAFALLLTPVIRTIFENHYFMKVMRTGMRVRSSLQGTIYEKSLHISPSARANSSLGEIVNLMQLDTQRIGDFFQFSNQLWASPVQIIVTVALLYNFIGVSAVIGLVVTMATLPAQSMLMSAMIKLRKESLGITDRRVKLMNEILQGIKAVKFYAWEEPFSVAVEDERKQELKKLSGTIWLRSTFMAIMMAIPSIIAVITFAFFNGVFGEELNPARIFTGLALLNQLRLPVMMLPMTINSLIDARIGVKRIERFLDLENTENYSREDPQKKDTALDERREDVDSASSSDSSESRPGSIRIKNGEFEWGEMQSEPSATEKKGWLSKCIPGLAKKKGVPETTEQRVESQPTAALSNEKNTSRRGAVLRNISVSAKGGELVAVVGRVGSGKSSLVHAILGEMLKVEGDVQVDGKIAYVAQTAWIFNETLRNNILFGKEFDEAQYRRAVTVSALQQDIDALPGGDMTAIGEKGINLSGGQKQRVSIARAVYADTDVYLFDDPLSALDAHVGQEVFKQCISKAGALGHRLRILITNQVQVLPECDKVIFLEDGEIRAQGTFAELASSNASFQQLIDEQEKGDNSKNKDAPPSESQSDTNEMSDEKAGTTLMQSEERKTGNVVTGAYYQYARACGGVLHFILLLVFWCVTVAMSVIVNWWLVYWADETAAGTERPLVFFLGIYFALAFGYAILVLIRGIWFLSLALVASRKLQSSMLQSVLHAPMAFFDTTPIGRIISRFSRDVSVLDELLPQFFQQMLSTVLNLIASYVFIGTILPIFFAAAIPITILYFALQRFFNRTSVELKRLDAISKSPIYAHFSETLGGLSTLRAYGKQDKSRAENMKMIDINQRAYFAWLAANRWFSLYLEFAGSLLIFATAVFSVTAPDSVSSGNIGLSLTYALQVTGILGFTVRSITELEGQMSSVERANYYSHDLPQEAPAKLDPKDGGGVSADWPTRGEICIKDVELLGVVGRTGSGKSSLMMALLRMVELANGSISVDGVNLRSLGLSDLRKRITIIPQDPVIFSGTIRFNLDPFSQHSDAELWDALEKSHMREFVEAFDDGLDAKVSEYGENLSAGQRQVICLTRALLRNSKILILDEASSSLDMETDRLIQETIRTHLKDATILTIAHRLSTLADYDKIILMENGMVAEFGSPAGLLEDSRGKFTALVNALGPAGSNRFREQVASGGQRR